MPDGPNFTATTIPRPSLDPVETDVPFAYVHINKCGGSSIEIALGLPKSHATAAEQRAAMGSEAWQAAYTFATVRNPFARVASIYYFRVRTDQDGLGDRHLSVNAWIREVFAERNPAYWQDGPLLAPAADWLCDGGEMLVEHVARLEDLDAEWPRICRRLGVQRTLEVTNRNSHPPYRAIFTDASRRIVDEAFAEDLERFGYSWNDDD